MAAKKRAPKTTAEAKGKHRSAAAAKRAADDPENNPEGKPTGGLTIARGNYVASKSASGKKTLTCGDTVAELLDGKSLDESFAILEDAVEKAGAEISIPELQSRWAHLNLGMQRMQVGHKLRKVINDGNLEVTARGKFQRRKKTAA